MTTIEELQQQLEKERTLRQAAEKRASMLSQALQSPIMGRSSPSTTTENKSLWQSIWEAAGDHVWECDMLSGRISLGSSFKSMLGYTEVEFPDTIEAYLQVIHPEDAATAFPNTATTSTNSTVSTREIRFRKKTGTYISVIDRYVITETGMSGKPVRLAGVMMMADALNRPAKTGAEVTNLLTQVIDNLQSAILVEDEEGNILLANDQFCDWFGWQRNSTTAWDASLSKHLFTDSYGFEYRVQQLLMHKQTVLNELLYTTTGKIWSRDFVPLYIDDTCRGRLWRYRDVTQSRRMEEALRKSEEKYRSIIENMKLGMVESDAKGIIRGVNQSICEMSGYTEAELLGAPIASIFTDGDTTAHDTQWKARRRGAATTYDVAIKNKRGEARWWHVSAAPLYDDANRFAGSIGVQLDITQQKRLEEQLRNAKHDAEQSAHAKESFLANISHEIRTPMNAIMGIGKLMRKMPLDDQQQRYLDAIQTATENLLVIINDVLDFSKIEAGKLSIERIGFSLDDLVRHALYVMRHKAEEKGLSLQYAADPALAPILLGDPYRINQILLNLLSNAIKFTDKGGVEIRIQVAKHTDAAQRLCLKVTDTGIGMSEEYRRQLFDKFTQEDETVTRKFGGTGLGMSISRQLIELMGGHMEVESTKGIGSSFSVFVDLPVGTPADMPRKEDHIIHTNGLKGKRLLLVEDNEMNRLVAVNMLLPYGAHITEAEHGQAALNLLAKDKFDLILMDLQMPVMDGIEATIRIRETIGEQIPIIALTANAQRGEQQRCYDAGMNDYIIKPFEEEHIVQLIARWLGQDIRLIRRHHSSTPTEELYYDMSKLRSLSRGNEDFVQRMLQLFVRDIPLSVARIEEAYSMGDLATVKALAHRIKPSIQNMGITLLKDDLPEMERLALSGDPEGRLAPMVEKLRNISAAVVAQIKEQLKP